MVGWVRRECGSPVVMVWTLSAAAWCSAAGVAMDFLGDGRGPGRLGGAGGGRAGTGEGGSVCVPPISSGGGGGGRSGGVRDAAQPGRRHGERVGPGPAG